MQSFEGLKILDLSRLLPGGYTTQYFAELGAEVIKIEDTGAGDYLRDLGPSLTNYADMSSYYFTTNYNKKSLSVDLKTQEGLSIIKKMVRSADIFIESFRPGTCKRLGIDYETLKEINPSLIYCSISAFGQSGPRSKESGHDINVLSLTGFLDVNGANKDAKPAIPGTQLADIGSGMASILNIVTALYERKSNGRGQYIDISMYDIIGSWMLNPYLDFLATSRVSQKGNELLSGGVLCYHIYETSDQRYLAFGAIEQKFWEAVCKILELPDLKSEGFAVAHDDNPQYIKLKEVIASKPLAEWVSAFDSLNCCVSPVLTIDEAMQESHFLARNIVEEINLEKDKYPKIRGPHLLRTQKTLTEKWNYPPKQGQQTIDILQFEGFTDREIEELLNKGIIKDSN